ncbi:hypothetical protein [Runella zeae]|uniref:hypothetical protein n=1 Tax=Runella zeae TaxID=94255 RepID=UPI002356F0C8|nr:hypothetical protein [Runella zeae]
MKNFLLLLLLLTFSIYVLGTPPTKRKPVTYTLEFDETGKLISEPPIRLFADDKLVFKVAVSRQLIEKRALEVYKAYYNTYLKIQDAEKYLDKNEIVATVDCKCLVEDVKRELKNEMISILGSYPTIAEEVQTLSPAFFVINATVFSSHFPFRLGCAPKTDFITKADDLIIPNYDVLITDINEKGVAIKDKIEPINNFTVADFVTNPHTEFTSNVITINSDLSKVRYELRQKNNYYEAVLEQLKAHPMPQKLEEFIGDFTASIKKVKAYEDEYKAARDSLDKYDKGQLSQHFDFPQSTSKIKQGTLAIQPFISNIVSILKEPSVIEWMLRFIWLNQGQLLADPFVIAENSSTPSEVRQTKDALQNAEAKISLLKEILKNDTQLRTYSTSRLDDYLKNYNALLTEQTQLKVRLDDLEKKNSQGKTSVASENEKIKARNEQLLREPWLYRGLLFVSERDSIFTRYHDASENYKLMNASSPDEIVEGQKMVLLVENEKSANQLHVKYEAKAIDYSLSFLEEEIAFVARQTRDASFPLGSEEKRGFRAENISFPNNSVRGWGTREAEDLRDALNDFATEHQKLKPFIDNVFQQGIADLPLQRKRDTDPVYTYKYLDVAIGKKPPYEVPYKIALTRAGKADSTLTDDKLNLSYSVYALHRFRFKVGPTYSSFRKDVFEIKDGTPFYSTEVSGIDALFGLQVFLTKKRINIREKNPSLRPPFAYLGFPISQDILRNVYIGGGFEIINGLGICVGTQIGQTSRLRFQNNVYTVDTKRWRAGGPFVSLLLDLSVFRTIFNFKTLQLPNPFRS